MILPYPLTVWSSPWHLSHGHRGGGHCPSLYIDIVGTIINVTLQAVVMLEPLQGASFWLPLQMVTSYESVLLCPLFAVANNSSVLVICLSSDQWFNLGLYLPSLWMVAGLIMSSLYQFKDSLFHAGQLFFLASEFGEMPCPCLPQHFKFPPFEVP